MSEQIWYRKVLVWAFSSGVTGAMKMENVKAKISIEEAAILDIVSLPHLVLIMKITH